MVVDSLDHAPTPMKNPPSNRSRSTISSETAASFASRRGNNRDDTKKNYHNQPTSTVFSIEKDQQDVIHEDDECDFVDEEEDETYEYEYEYEFESEYTNYKDPDPSHHPKDSYSERLSLQSSHPERIPLLQDLSCSSSHPNSGSTTPSSSSLSNNNNMPSSFSHQGSLQSSSSSKVDALQPLVFEPTTPRQDHSLLHAPVRTIEMVGEYGVPNLKSLFIRVGKANGNDQCYNKVILVYNNINNNNNNKVNDTKTTHSWLLFVFFFSLSLLSVSMRSIHT